MATEPDDNDGIEDERANRQRRRADRPAARERDRDDEPRDEDRPRRRRRRDPDEDEPAIGDDLGMRMLLPVGRSIWAIIAGYFGLISVLFFPAPFALIFGVIAIVDIKMNPKKHGLGRAIFAVVMGTIFSIGLAIGVISILMNPRR